MKKVIEYCTVCTNPTDFIYNIYRLLEGDWQPIGGLCVYEDMKGSLIFAQAMVKYEKEQYSDPRNDQLA